jgi:thioredoxin-dependent peroxiredoxin
MVRWLDYIGQVDLLSVRLSDQTVTSTNQSPFGSSRTAPEQRSSIMPIQPGTPAPTFTTRDANDHPVTLEDFTGKWLLLSFLRNGACALCNLRVHQLIQRFPELRRRGLEIVTIFESPTSSIRQSVGKQAAPFPIVPDPDAKLYALYGVETSAEKLEATMRRPQTPQVIQEAAEHGFPLTLEEGSNFHRLPADFLIGPDSIVRIAHYAEYAYDHLGFDRLEPYL